MSILGEMEDGLRGSDGWRQRFGGQKWRLTTRGVETPADGLLRTPGEPTSIRAYLEHWRTEIERASREGAVPAELLLATIATENGAVRGGEKPYVRPPREEPGYLSDHATPHRVSVGPCHLLLSTARQVLGRAGLTRTQLADLATNLLAAAHYIRSQAPLHGMDPVLVAASYNSGGLYDSSDPASRWHNPWHLRSTGNHLTRFGEWYGDAIAVLSEEGPEPLAREDLPEPRMPPFPHKRRGR